MVTRLLREPRSYSVPDRGCRVSPRCVDCHLGSGGISLPERCKYDEPNGMLTIRSRRTRYLIEGLHRLGWPAKMIHHRIKVPLSTVYRILGKPVR